MVDHHKTKELGSLTLTCMFEDETGEKSCEVIDNSNSREGVRLKEEDLHNLRSTAEEIWEELEEKYGGEE